jgi:hypothetical protein
VISIAMESPIWEFRASAVPSLARFAKAGNERAIQSLMNARGDPNEHVRRNAENCSAD